jgi:hypothetical protein
MFVLLLASSFYTLGWASTVVGKVVKFDGAVCIIKDDISGKESQLHVDQTTIKQGEIKTGTRVEAEVDDKTGHAKSIKEVG